MQTPRAIRERARRSQLKVAAEANRSIPVVRLYEADRHAVSKESRAVLDPIYERMRKEVGQTA
jgi:hypothetical protein